jgi:hypothetical protein
VLARRKKATLIGATEPVRKQRGLHRADKRVVQLTRPEETIATAKNKLDRLLEDTHELEAFLHALLPALDEQKLRQGDDVLGYARKMKLRIPESLRATEVTWETDHSDVPTNRGGESLSFAQPGHAGAIGLVIRCVRIGKWRVCLECGWIWCRIVVTRRF